MISSYQDAAARCAALARRLEQEWQSRGYEPIDARAVALHNCTRVSVATLVSINILARAENDVVGSRTLHELSGKIARDAAVAAEVVDVVGRLSVVLLYQFQVEALFKALLREMGITLKTDGYYTVARRIVKETGVPNADFDTLYVPARLRNALHSNGVHHDRNSGQTTTVSVKGVTYEFLEGQQIACGTWLHVFNALEAATDVLCRILDSARVAALPSPIKL